MQQGGRAVASTHRQAANDGPLACYGRVGLDRRQVHVAVEAAAHKYAIVERRTAGTGARRQHARYHRPSGRVQIVAFDRAQQVEAVVAADAIEAVAFSSRRRY